MFDVETVHSLTRFCRDVKAVCDKFPITKVIIRLSLGLKVLYSVKSFLRGHQHLDWKVLSDR